jgi:hypothetical protein
MILFDSNKLQALHHQGKDARGSIIYFSDALIDQGQTPP